jgi:hypothetical protein
MVVCCEKGDVAATLLEGCAPAHHWKRFQFQNLRTAAIARGSPMPNQNQLITGHTRCFSRPLRSRKASLIAETGAVPAKPFADPRRVRSVMQNLEDYQMQNLKDCRDESDAKSPPLRS